MEYFKFLYKPQPSIEINLKSISHNPYEYITKENKIIKYPTFYDTDEISGNIQLKLNSNKSLIYEYISIYLYGKMIIINSTNSKIVTEIFKESQELTEKKSPNIITNEITNFSFNFTPKVKPYETYIGNLIQIKYYIKAIIKTNNINSPNLIEKEIEIACIKPEKKIICDEIYLKRKEKNNIEINIGVENIIHVRLNLVSVKLFLDDVILGKIKIIKSEIELNNIYMAIKKEEKYYQLDNAIVKNEELSNYEIAEGFIEQGDEFCFKYFLRNIKNLTPSYDYKDDNKNKLSVKYYLCFSFNDSQGYQFFKYIEIYIYRMNLSDMNKEQKNFISLKKLMNKDDKKSSIK